jgi:hypothetical protein
MSNLCCGATLTPFPRNEFNKNRPHAPRRERRRRFLKEKEANLEGFDGGAGWESAKDILQTLQPLA